MELVLSGSRGGDGFISVCELQTGSHYNTFKQNSSASNTLTCTKEAVFSAQDDKATLNVYRWHKEAIDQKMILPESLCALAVSVSGTFLLGGSKTGKIYLWELASGILHFVRDAHYQAVTTCKWSDDDLNFFTASEDGSLQAWSLSTALDSTLNQDLIRPLHNISPHTLAITDMVCGVGSSVFARLYTASLDNTIKIWDIATFELITTLLLPSSVTCIEVDPAERFVFAGLDDGTIYEIPLFAQEPKLHAVGGFGSIVTTSGVEHIYKGHEAAVTCLALSFDGQHLISGAEDGNTFVWECLTRQMLRKLKRHDYPVSVVLVTCQAPILALQTKKIGTSYTFQPLKRMQNERERDEHYVHLAVDHTRDSLYQPPSDLDAVSVALVDLAANAPSSGTGTHEEVMQLKEELSKMYNTYEALKEKYEKLVQAEIDRAIG